MSIASAVWPLAILLGLLAADFWSLQLYGRQGYRLDIGSGADEERHFIRGLFKTETDPAGTTYRWSGERGSLTIRGFASVAQPMLELAVGAVPAEAQLPRVVRWDLDGAEWLALPVTAGSRRYTLLLPPRALADGDLDLRWISPVSRVPPDAREVGIRLDDIALRWTSAERVLPTSRTLLVQAALVLVALAVARRLHAPRWSLALIALGAVALLGWITGRYLLVATAWQSRLLAAGALLLLALWTLLPRLLHLFPELGARELRRLALVTVVATAIRLWGLMYPSWGSHDLYIHRQRLLATQLGSVFLFDTPSEFASRKVVVPPALYLLASPLTLVMADPGVAIHGMVALLDGATPLLLALLVRRLGGGERAGLLAALAIAALPLQLTALWWGFAPQIVGQALLLPLAILAAGAGEGRAAGAAALLLTLIFFMHSGVAILGGAWLAGYLALEWWARRELRGPLIRWLLALGLAGAVALALLYSVGLQPPVQSAASFGLTVEERARIARVGGGLLESAAPLGAALPLLSLLLLLRFTRGRGRRLVVAWLLAALLFLLVDIATGAQVRYGYFAVPLLCAGLSLLLDQLMSRGRAGRLAGAALLTALVFWGLRLWIGGVFWAVKPVVSGLTH